MKRSLPEDEWLGACMAIAGALRRDRPLVFLECVSALESPLASRGIRRGLRYEEERHALPLQVAQLLLVSLAIRRRGEIALEDLRPFLNTLWVQVLRDEFPAGNELAEELARETGGTPMRLFRLLALVAAEITGATDRSDAMLLLCRVGRALMEQSDAIAQAAFSRRIPPPFAVPGLPAIPLFDDVLLSHVGRLRGEAPAR
jgi:hypothetical protein